MTDSIDVYSDQFTITVGPYGASLSFAVTEPHPIPTAPQPPERVATIRMSVEHLKIMAMIIVRHVKKMEEELGVSFPISSQVLNQLGIGKEDWDGFWSR